MKKEHLIKYCQKHDIMCPKDATIEFLCAAIFRHRMNDKDIGLKDKGQTCFGLWAYENATCMTCDHEAKCFKASIGMDKDKFFKKLSGTKVRV